MTLQQLWDLAEEAGRRENKDFESVFDPVGLLLDRRLIQPGYTATPLNTLTFADTGGDGVHFGFLKFDGRPDDSGPVVMTVPCSFDAHSNVFLGENLHEFLCLGCHFGYFELEQLVYDRADTLARIEQREPPGEAGEHLLSLLRTTFHLKPWDNVWDRLVELNRKYLPLLQMSPKFSELYGEDIGKPYS